MTTAQAQHKAASEKFLEAVELTRDSRTKYALRLLSDSHSRRAMNESNPANTQPRRVTPPPAAGAVAETVKEETQDGETQEDSLTSSLRISSEPVGLEPIVDRNEQLQVAEAEMNELWRQLNELGFSRQIPSTMSSSKHFSSSLGDSFCILPTKARAGTIGATAKRIDGAATLRAAAASRLRNQRTRMASRDVLHQHTHSLHAPSRVDPKGEGAESVTEAEDKQQALITHQKHEIMRLLQSIKTLSSENTKLLKECDDRAKLFEENKALKEAMKTFQDQYQQKFIALKRALEEWRRQNEKEGTNEQMSQQIRRLTEDNKRKDALIARYENWYKTLKAGAKAKQQTRSFEASGKTS